MSKSKTNGSVKIHPAAELFPLMDDGEFGRLLEDVKNNGLHFAVVFRGDELIDGRNRLRAIQELGLNLDDHRTTVDPSEIPDPIDYVLSLNLHRRHLNESQRAMVANKVASLRKGDNQHAQICATSSQSDAATSLNVGKRSVQNARKVSEKAVPEIIHAVEHGDISVSAAAEISDLPKSEQKKLAKAGAKAVTEAASKKRKAKSEPKPRAKGQPSGGTKFDPSEWDKESEPVEDESAIGKVPPHLKEVVSGTSELRRIVRSIQAVRRDLESAVQIPAGAWLAWSDLERQCKQLELDVKLRLYACNCPNCKNKINNNCGKCGGRGWIDKRHESMLTNEEKKWVEDNQ